MDYCSTCRRHLNGALVCPGCGAYAPDIAPVAMATWFDDRRHDEADAGSGRDDGTGVQGPRHAPVAASAAHGGRAARRRQLARLRKHQRRAVIATAIALVGGGLSFATMNRGTTERAQATTAPDDTIMGGAGKQTTGVEEATPEQGSRPASPTPSTQASDPASPRVPGQRSATTPPATQSHTVTTTAPQQQRQSLPLLPSAPDTPVTTPTPSSTPSDPATTAPTPTPTPSQTTPSTAPTTPPPAQLCLLVICLG
ncbi:hypothetical protein [Streptomyces sp. GESEQ-35]|uniref:SCO2400 family protein n=1 Tax=Streptomyces sp. GESEQ-35 TaxID=2812657 RepID=UPI001B33DEFD|nr:hypothetical protein [Streptomyces sp. GESEQ-35]